MASGESVHLTAKLIREKARRDDVPGPFQSKVGIRAVEYRSLDQMMCLGKGATVTMHKAMFEGKVVAMKTILGADMEKFQKETLVFSGLSHPNVTQFYCYAANTRKCTIVMEFMDGDLRHLMHKRMDNADTDDCPPFEIAEAVDIIHQIAEGMDYLHQKRIVHRDLKAPNILYKMVEGKSKSGTRDVHVKLADFGLSKMKKKSRTYSNLTPNEGTPRWMPPELIQFPNMEGQVNTTDSERAPKLPFKCDVYSFSMVCFEILTGEVPFHEIDTAGVSEMVLNGKRPGFPNHCPCPPKLKALIEKCRNQEPSERPSFDFICEKLKDLNGFLLAAPTLSQRSFPTILDNVINSAASSSAGSNVGPSHVRGQENLEPKLIDANGRIGQVYSLEAVKANMFIPAVQIFGDTSMVMVCRPAHLQQFGLKPYVVTFSGILNACSRCASLQEASVLLEQMRFFDSWVCGIAHGLLMGLRGQVWFQALRLYDEIARMDYATGAAFYNALTDVFWHFDQREGAQKVVVAAKRRQMWENAWWHSEQQFCLDLHLMSVGAAQAMLHVWLLDLRDMVWEGHDLPRVLSISTGSGYKVGAPSGTLKRAVESMLQEIKSPFLVGRYNEGRLVCTGHIVRAWLGDPRTSKLLTLKDAIIKSNLQWNRLPDLGLLSLKEAQLAEVAT